MFTQHPTIDHLEVSVEILWPGDADPASEPERYQAAVSCGVCEEHDFAEATWTEAGAMLNLDDLIDEHRHADELRAAT